LLLKFWTVCVLEPPLGGLRVNIYYSSWLIGKRIVDFLFVLIELYSLAVTPEALRAKTDGK